MNEPLGEYGGVVTRKLVLFGRERPVGEEITPEELGEVSLRHRKALQGAGLVKYYSEPEGAAAGFTSTAPETETTVKAKSPPNKSKTKTKKKKASRSKSKTKRR